MALALALFLVFLAGRFSMYRIVPEWLALGLAGEVRYWAIALLTIAVVSVYTISPRKFDARATGALRWLLVVEILLAFVALSIIWTPSPAASFLTFTDVVALGLMLALIPPILNRDPQGVARLLLYCFFVSGLVYFVAGASGIWRDGDRWSALGGGANVFVRVMVSAAIAAVYLCARERRLLWLATIPLFSIGALASGSRGGLIAAIVIYPISLWLLLADRRRVAVGLLAAAAGLVLSSPVDLAIDKARQSAAAAVLPSPKPLQLGPPLASGTYDDNIGVEVSSLQWVGSWTSNVRLDHYGGSLHYSNRIGARVVLHFTGTRIAPVYASYPDAGIGAVSVDGVQLDLLDTYAPEPKFRQLKAYNVAPGRHIIEVKVSGEKNPASNGRWIYVDGFVVDGDAPALVPTLPATPSPGAATGSGPFEYPVTANPRSGPPLWEVIWERYFVTSFLQGNLADRDRLFKAALQLFAEHPIAGIGVDGFRVATGLGEPYPHNLLLLIAAETGLVGLLIGAGIVPSLVRRRQALALEHRAALSLGLYYLAASMFSGGWYDTRFMWLTLLVYLWPFSAARTEPAAQTARSVAPSVTPNPTPVLRSTTQ